MSSSSTIRWILRACALAGGACTLSLGCQPSCEGERNGRGAQVTSKGAARATAPGRPTYSDFRISTSSGPWSLEDAQEEVVIVYFGYTACPDVCPTTLAALGAAFRQLPEDIARQATTVFVSVDPERDSLDRIDRYVRYFHPSFRAGTSSLERLQRIADDWGVFFRAAPDRTSALGYTVDHSTQAFLWSRKTRPPEQLSHGTPPRVLAERIRARVAGE